MRNEMTLTGSGAVDSLRALVIALAVMAEAGCADRSDHEVKGVAWDSGTYAVDSVAEEIFGSAAETGAVLGVVVGIVSTGSRGVLIADGSDNTIWYREAAGRPFRTIGRSGTGPGEFRRLVRLLRCPSGSLVAVDFGTKFVRYAADGAIRSEIPTPMSAHRFVGCASENALVLQIDGDGRVPESLGLHRQASRLVLFTPDSSSERTIGEYAGTTYFYSKRGEYFIDVPLAPRTLAAAGSTWLYVMDTDKPVVHAVSLAGAERRAIPVTIQRQPLAPGAFDRAVDERLATIPVAETRRIVAPIRSELPEAEELPYVDAVVTGPRDVVWLRSFEGDARGWRLWHAYGADGSSQGTLVLPSALEVMEIGDNSVLGVLREESGDERVVRYRFRQRVP
jgi:hypothetical protein